MEDDWGGYIQYPPVYGIEVDETENLNPVIYLPDGVAIQRKKQIGFIWIDNSFCYVNMEE